MNQNELTWMQLLGGENSGGIYRQKNPMSKLFP